MNLNEAIAALAAAVAENTEVSNAAVTFINSVAGAPGHIAALTAEVEANSDAVNAALNPPPPTPLMVRRRK